MVEIGEQKTLKDKKKVIRSTSVTAKMSSDPRPSQGGLRLVPRGTKMFLEGCVHPPDPITQRLEERISMGFLACDLFHLYFLASLFDLTLFATFC